MHIAIVASHSINMHANPHFCQHQRAGKNGRREKGGQEADTRRTADVAIKMEENRKADRRRTADAAMKMEEERKADRKRTRGGQQT